MKAAGPGSDRRKYSRIGTDQVISFAPVDEKDYLRYRTAIEADYVWHDKVLGAFLDRADAETTVVVVSDHGFKSGEYRRGDPSDFHAKTGAMWHRPFGVFYAWGNGVARGRRIKGRVPSWHWQKNRKSPGRSPLVSSIP